MQLRTNAIKEEFWKPIYTEIHVTLQKSKDKNAKSQQQLLEGITEDKKDRVIDMFVYRQKLLNVVRVLKWMIINKKTSDEKIEVIFVLTCIVLKSGIEIAHTAQNQGAT